MKHTKEVIANALALTTAIFWVIDTLFVSMLPRFSLRASRWMAHGMPVDEIGPFNITFYNFIWGGALLVVFAWIFGYLFGWSLEYFSKKK